MPINGLAPVSERFGRHAYDTLHRARPRGGPRARRDLPAHPVHVLDGCPRKRQEAPSWSMLLAAPRRPGSGHSPCALGAALPACAIDLLDRSVQIHGFYEAQIRSLVRDYDISDGWDLAQWWNVLDVEFEWAAAPDGFGPFDNVNVFGAHRGPLRLRLDPGLRDVRLGERLRRPHRKAPQAALGRAPQRLLRARNWTGDTRHYYDVPFTDVNSTPEPRAPAPLGRADCPGVLPDADRRALLRLRLLRSRRRSRRPPTTRPSSSSSRCSAPTATSGAPRARPNGSQNGRGNARRPAPRSRLRLRHDRRPPPTSRTPSGPATSTR